MEEIGYGNDYIEDIQRLHCNYNLEYSWYDIIRNRPTDLDVKEAKLEYENFKPKFINKILRNEESIKRHLKEEIENQKKEFEEKIKQWDYEKEIARGVIDGNLQSMRKAIHEYRPFDKLLRYISNLKFNITDCQTIKIIYNSNIENVVPKNDNHRDKKMGKYRYNELIQNYICSLNIRIALDILAFLPTIERVDITTCNNILNTSTGYFENAIIYKVVIDKTRLKSINIKRIKPSDALKEIFNADYKYTKTKGFSKLEEKDIQRNLELL